MQTTTTAPTATCICGNCPAIRLARGLVPFCQIDTTAPSRLPVDKGFASYSEAAAARKDGQRIVSVGNRLHSGSAKRFFLV